MTYFDHPYASNSGIKEIVDRYNGKTKPDNIQLIYDFGTNFHSGILEPHKSTAVGEDAELIAKMAKSFWKDELCRNIAMAPDFRREHEFYRVNRFGLIGTKCKCDGESKKLRIILELKGLSVTTDKAFRESIEHLGYDQGASWYLNTTLGHVRYDYKLIAGLSKIDPERPPFKLLIGWDDKLYKQGMYKAAEGVKIWKAMGLQ